jgi:hypothetical protein
VNARPSPSAETLIERDGRRLIASNGRVALDFDLRSGFPFFNFVWLADAPGASYRRFCNFGAEAMPDPGEVLAELGVEPNDAPAEGEEAAPPATVWLMGHDYKAKPLRHAPERLDLQVTYPPPMIVVAEMSALAGSDGAALADFPDGWGELYWERVETTQHSIQAVWSMEAGQPWVDLQMIPALGRFVSLMPSLHHGFCGHADIPMGAWLGGRFSNPRSPSGDYVAHTELMLEGRGGLLHHAFGEKRLFLFFGEEPNSTAIAIGLHAADENGFLFLGQNESGAAPEGPFHEAASRGAWRPESVVERGFTDQTLFLDAGTPGRALSKVRYAFYQNEPLPYGNATKIREWAASKPELRDFLG